jgi:hypothetical protein
LLKAIFTSRLTGFLPLKMDDGCDASLLNHRHDYFCDILSRTDLSTKDFGPLLTTSYFGLSNLVFPLLSSRSPKLKANAAPALHLAAQIGNLIVVAILLRAGIIHTSKLDNFKAAYFGPPPSGSNELDFHCIPVSEYGLMLI